MRLSWSTSRPWGVGVVLWGIAQAAVPALVVMALGMVVGRVAAVLTSGFVDRLPNGLATPVGTAMTGGRGQWLKLAVGRAFLRDDPLLVVLDEPTASLDAHAEHAPFARYRRRPGGARPASAGDRADLAPLSPRCAPPISWWCSTAAG